jgi:hypothetical protein
MTLSIYLVEHCIEDTFVNFDYPSPQRTNRFHTVLIVTSPSILLPSLFVHRPEISDLEHVYQANLAQ